jgi:hypothetical protein
MRCGKGRGEESTRTVAGGEIGNDVSASSGAESVGLSGGVLTARKRSLLAGAILCGMLSVLMA